MDDNVIRKTIQRLMEKGYGFGGEGDWKTAAMGIEAVYIDKDTTIRQFKNELMWNSVVCR